MKCPNCKEELNLVRGYSQAMQYVKVDEKGNVLGHSSIVNHKSAFTDMECDDCHEDVTSLINL